MNILAAVSYSEILTYDSSALFMRINFIKIHLNINAFFFHQNLLKLS